MTAAHVDDPGGFQVLPPRRILADDTYATLLARLMDGDIPPGGRVNIEAVARQLDVSPTPVREALVRLEVEGLVVKTVGKGYTAAPLLDAEAFAHLFEMRILLEPAATRLSAGRVDLDELDQLQSELAEAAEPVGRAGEGYETYRAFAEADSRMHLVLARASGNPLLAEAIARLRAHTHLYRLSYTPALASAIQLEHDAVLEALRRGDADAAESAMRSHIERARQRMVEHIPRG